MSTTAEYETLFTFRDHKIAPAMWNNLARAEVPDNLGDLLAIASHLFASHGTYAQALKSVAAYFLTDLNLTGDNLPANVRKDITRFINQDSGILASAPDIGAQLLAMGIVFLTIHIPFVRWVVCPECSARYVLKARLPGDVSFSKKVTYKDGDTGPGFVGRCGNEDCPSKGARVVFGRPEDEPMEPSISNPVRPVMFPPQIMRVIWSPLTDERTPMMDTWKYAELREGVELSIPEILYDTRWEYIESVVSRTPILFDKRGMCCIVMEPPPDRKMMYKGWGCMAYVPAFSSAARVILLDLYNQIITAEFSMPRRVISPPAESRGLTERTGSAAKMSLDYRNLMSPSEFKAKVQAVITRLRLHPEEIAVSPFPLNYQLLGAEAGTLITPEQLEAAIDRLVQEMGILPELYKGGINAMVATPTMFGAKVFENRWVGYISKLNEAMDWLTDRVGERKQWPSTQAKFTPTSMVVDPLVIDLIQARSAEGKVSDYTQNRITGLDGDFEDDMIRFEEEVALDKDDTDAREDTSVQINRLLEDADAQAKQMKTQTAADQALQATVGELQGGQAAPAPGQAPGGPGMAASAPMVGGEDAGATLGIPELAGISLPPGGLAGLTSVDQLRALGEAIAAQILTVPIPQRGIITENIKQQNNALHMFVMDSIAVAEDQAAQMGTQALRAGQM